MGILPSLPDQTKGQLDSDVGLNFITLSPVGSSSLVSMRRKGAPHVQPCGP